MDAKLVQFGESLPAWEKAFYAFLAEKERRSGSTRTVDAYSRTLQRFFGTLGKTPAHMTPPDVFGFAHGIGPPGKELAPPRLLLARSPRPGLPRPRSPRPACLAPARRAPACPARSTPTSTDPPRPRLLESAEHMKLPNHEAAAVPEEKIIGYLLSATHRDGRHKAAFFLGFGFAAGAPETLGAALLKHAAEHDVSKAESTPFGTRYVVEGTIETPSGRTPRIRVQCGSWRATRTHHASSRLIRSKEKAMTKELDTVVLTEDLPEHGLKRGDLGTVVLLHPAEGYEVEFMTLDGQTLAVVSLASRQVRPVGRREIAQARAVA